MNETKQHAVRRLGMMIAAGSTIAALIVGLRRLPEKTGAVTDASLPTAAPKADHGTGVPVMASVKKPESSVPGYVRWLLFFGALVAGVLLLMGPRSTISTLVFVVVVAGSLVIGLLTWKAAPAVSPVPRVDVRGWMAARRVGISQVLGGAAVVCMAVSAYWFRPDDDPKWIGPAVLAFLAGGAWLWAALRFQPARLNGVRVTEAASAPFVIRWRFFLLGALCIGLFSEMSGRVLGVQWLIYISSHVQFVLLCIGVVLIVISLTDKPLARARTALSSVDGLALAVIVLVALFLRFWELNTSIRVLVDEIHFSSGVTQMWYGGDIGLMRPMSGLSPFPWIYPYWQMHLVAVFGRNLLGLRAASAILGTLNVLAIYAFARALFDRKIALLAAALLAVYPPHLHFSRVAILQIADPLFATVGFAFIGRGLRDNRQRDYALGGAGIAFSQYFYEAGRVLFPPLTVLWLGGLAFFWRERLRAHRRGLLTAAVVFALLTVPVYYTLIAMHYPLTGRLNASGLDSVYWNHFFTGDEQTRETYGERLVAPWLFYVHQPETGSTYYGGTEPLVMTAVLPLFLLGAFHVVWRLRSPGMLLMALWVAATAFGNSLLVGSAVASRYLVIYPAFPVIMAIGIRYTLPLLWPGRLTVWVRYVIAGGLVAALAVVQVGYYFGPHLDIYQVQSRPRRDIQDAVLRSVDFPPCTRIHVISSPLDDGRYGNEMLAFFADRLIMDSLTPDEVNEDYIKLLFQGVDHAFFLEPADTRTLAFLREQLYLEGPYLSPYPMPPRKQYILYYAPYLLNRETIGREPKGCG